MPQTPNDGSAPRRKTLVIVLIHVLVLIVLLVTDDATCGPATRAFDGWSGNQAMKFVTGSAQWHVFGSFGEGLAVVFAAATIWALDKRRRATVKVLLAGAILASAISGILSFLIGRERPKRSRNITKVVTIKERIKKPRSMSFPSGHATAAASLATFLSLSYPPLRPVMVTMAIGCGVSRLKFRKHFIGDIYAGLLMGHYTMLWVWWAFQRRKSRERERAEGGAMAAVSEQTRPRQRPPDLGSSSVRATSPQSGK